VSGRREFQDLYRILRENYLAGREVTSRERQELRALWEAAERHYRAGPQRIPAGVVLPWRPPPWDRIAAGIGLDNPDDLRPPGKRQRQQPAHQLPIEKVRRLQAELAKRRKAGNPNRGPLTLERIAERVDLHWHRARQGAQLLELGWGDLLRSDPDFPPDPGHVRWPTVKRAKRLVAP
jgi:hypothetical protein